MAESAVSTVIDKLVQLLTQEILWRSAQKEVEDIQHEIESIRALLKEAHEEEKEGTCEGIKAWVKQVREAAYQIEDVIDKYTLHIGQAQQNRYRYRRGFNGLLPKIVSLIKRLKLNYQIVAEVQEIKEKLEDIKDRCERYRFNSSRHGASSSNLRSTSTPRDPQVGSFYIKEAELVGVEALREKMIDQLIHGEFSRKVISVVGMGGVGKTTLSKNVFDSQRVIAHFDCHAWICVPQEYKKDELLKSILMGLYEARKETFPRKKISSMDYFKLIKVLNEYLECKRYLIVFDDVWEINFWGDVEHALLDNNRGSRIIITTRRKGVADFCKRSSLVHIHPMEPLSSEHAWELFCKKAFQFEFDGHNIPEELKELSYDIVRRCGELPLAIVAIGGLLATKEKVVHEWRKLRNSLDLALVTNPQLADVIKIISLSYNDLPYTLRSCFLYFGMFPKGYSINCTRLIGLWIAGGFVKGELGMTLEVVAEEYLNELINRNLVQVGKLSIEGKPKTCRVHDFVYQAILSKSEELSFHHVSESCPIVEGVTRHLSICNSSVDIISKRSTKSQIRTILVFNIDDLPKHLIHTIFTISKLLTSLDFEEAPLNHVPWELGNMLHLKYLSLRSTRVKVLPKSIGKLLKLERLDLRNSLVRKLPVELRKFPNLQHLLCYSLNYDDEYGINFYCGLKIKGSIGCSVLLQNLYSIEVSNGDLITELGMLKQLRKLGIKKLRRDYGRALCISLQKMTNLCSLRVSSTTEEELLELQSISSPPLSLQSLFLRGRLDKLPNWIAKLKYLVKFGLYWSKMMDDPIKDLEALPNLMHLRLYDAYQGEQLHFGEGIFKKLKVLYLGFLKGLNKLIIEQGALPCLEELTIASCCQLKVVPPEIQHLKSLKTLRFWDMPKEFVQRMLPEEGQDYWIVKQILFVYFDHTIKRPQLATYKLGPELVKYLSDDPWNKKS